MGFLAVALGIIISDCNNHKDFLDLIAITYLRTFDHASKIIRITLTLHNDIIHENGKTITVCDDKLSKLHFTYKNDENIKIGAPLSSAYMIYVGDVPSISDETMSHLLQWKRELMAAGRISMDTKFGVYREY